VVGLLEVFSPHPRAFTKIHGTVLKRLVEMIPKAHREKTQPESAQPENTQLQPPIKPDAMSGGGGTGASPVQSSLMQPHPSESGSTEPTPAEFSSLHALREALWDRNAEVPEQVHGQIVSEQVPDQVPEQIPEPAPASQARLPYRALLGLTSAVVATALGYLVGPVVMKWTESPRGAQRSLVQGAVVQGAEAALTVSGQSATDRSSGGRSSADRRPQPRSPEDLRKLADQGDADAQWQMGVRYHDGEGVAQDDAQAVRWFQRAAEQGNVAAQGALGAYYWRGRGVPEDLSKAYFWSAIAVAQGDEISKSRLEGLASQMTRAQVSAARQQAEAWIHTHSQRAKAEPN
jgi:hypothetical protein